jgi:TPR repeat protein
MLPWKNSWFQIAFFAWIVSGALLIVDYAPKITVNSQWTKAFERAPRQPLEAPAKPSPLNQYPVPAPNRTPARQPPSRASKKPVPIPPGKSSPAPSPENPTPKAPTTSAPSDASTELAQGQAAYLRKDYIQAMQWFQKAAAQGNANAEEYIGNLYRYGYGVQTDYVEAMKWYQKAAAQGKLSLAWT